MQVYMVFFFLLFLQICQNYGKKTQVVDSYIVESLQNGRILENLLAEKGKCAIIFAKTKKKGEAK